MQRPARWPRPGPRRPARRPCPGLRRPGPGGRAPVAGWALDLSLLVICLCKMVLLMLMLLLHVFIVMRCLLLVTGWALGLFFVCSAACTVWLSDGAGLTEKQRRLGERVMIVVIMIIIIIVILIITNNSSNSNNNSTSC